jgi:hypothetical protein
LSAQEISAFVTVAMRLWRNFAVAKRLPDSAFKVVSERRQRKLDDFVSV